MMTTRTFTIADIRAANKAAGLFFFSPKTMKAFASKIDRRVYAGVGGVFFVTSEQHIVSSEARGPRKFTVRRFNPDTGDVSTAANTFQRFYDVGIARAYARALAENYAQPLP